MKNPIEQNFKEWYQENYPYDDMGCEINEYIPFSYLLYSLESGRDIYTMIGVCDSVIRERLFIRLAEIMEVDYDFVYNIWLNTSA